MVIQDPPVVQVHLADGTATVALHGEVDIASVADLRDALSRAVAVRPGRLVVDLADTSFVDCSVVNAIAGARRDAPPGCRIVIGSPSPFARRVIQLTGLDRLCPIDNQDRASGPSGPRAEMT